MQRKRIHTGFGNLIHIKYKFNSNREEIFERAVKAVKYARNLVMTSNFTKMPDVQRTNILHAVQAVIDAELWW